MNKEKRTLPVVNLIFRKPVANFFSIEKVFFVVVNEFKNSIASHSINVPFASASLYNVLRNILSVRKLKSDLFHITGDVHYVVLGLPRKKTLLTIHDCVFLYRYKGIKKWFMHRLFLKWPVKYCRQITTISERTKQDIIEHTGCAADKIMVIPNPVSKQITYHVRTFNKQKPVILFIGTTANKNLERVVQAVAEIPCVLEIIGPLSVDIKKLLTKYAIHYQNSFGLTEDELAKKYADCDIVLFPSLFEGFGLPIIEGQKAGRVVITSDLQPMKDVCGEGACLIDPFSVDTIRESVLKVIDDDAYRNELIQKGFLNVKKYEPEYISKQYVDLYYTFLNINSYKK
jgi:glycosyltransferase involved in cell wall biosynthesis